MSKLEGISLICDSPGVHKKATDGESYGRIEVRSATVTIGGAQEVSTRLTVTREMLLSWTVPSRPMGRLCAPQARSLRSGSTSGLCLAPFARKLALYIVGLSPPRTRSLRSYLVNPQKARNWTASQSLAAR